MELATLRLGVAIKSLLLDKAMRRSIQSSHHSVSMANLLSSDVSSVLAAAFQINNVWVLPLQIAAIVYMLYDLLALAAFAGLAVIAVSMAISLRIATLSSAAMREVKTRSDARMAAIQEMFGAIQTVKLHAWETPMVANIEQLRAHELEATARYMNCSALSVVVLWVAPLCVSTVSFAVYALVLGQPLTAAKVFTAMALFNALRSPLRDLPSVVSLLIQAKVSLDRIQAFLAIHEVDATNVTRSSGGGGESDAAYAATDVAIEIRNGSFSWTTPDDGDTPVLTNVNLQVKTGNLVVVHGAVGAGKSSLCAALLGEMHKLSGSVYVRGRVAYYSQQTWIQHSTIRDNILFGSEYDEVKYARVLDACGLRADVAALPSNDLTEIGQKGVNLSGGQKARLCLARACYADADVLILDSPLAAVDAAVQNEILRKCLCGLLAHKTVVLVTHSREILALDAVNCTVEIVDGVAATQRRRDAPQHRISTSGGHAAAPQEPHETVRDPRPAGRVVVESDEERAQGRVSWTVYRAYFDAFGGMRMCVFLLLVQTLWQACQIASDLWLAHWTGQPTPANHDYTQTAVVQRNLVIYVLLALASAALVLVRAMVVATGGLRASTQLFRAMTRALVHTPLSFFDANPIGRILNRYSPDMLAIDFMLPPALGGALATTLVTLCQLTVAVVTVHVLGLLVVPIVVVYVGVALFFVAPSREVSRLWKISASPVLSHVTACEDGASVLRAFGPAYVHRALSESLHRNDVRSKVWVVETVLNQWFHVRMQLLGAAIVIVIVSALVYLRAVLSPGVVGVAFTYALNVDSGLATLVRVWSWIEVCMVGPERVLAYAALPAEGDSKLLQLEPPADWPTQGSLAFENVCFRYTSSGPQVLRNVSFAVRDGEKIGIVGRTSAGKSSLAMALFRIQEIASGRVLLDGRDLASVPIPSLRSRLAIIPQTPVLFKGTLRDYMDPFHTFRDDEIWAVLCKVEMQRKVTALPGLLQYELRENGDNLSVGERQLLCMARALLTKARVVVLDEATASIDHATELTLQRMLRTEFQHATVLTIAHRLTTVLDCDRILVMRDGRVVEFDTPEQLLTHTEDGVFYELAKEAGAV